MSDSRAQLDRDADNAYTEREAQDAFTRMVTKYGWNKWQLQLNITADVLGAVLAHQHCCYVGYM